MNLPLCNTQQGYSPPGEDFSWAHILTIRRPVRPIQRVDAPIWRWFEKWRLP